MKNSAGEITRSIIKIEKENNLFKWEIDGIFIWEIIRHKIYADIIINIDSKGYLNKRRFGKEVEYLFKKTKYKIEKYINAILFNPYFDSKKIDAIIFESSRKLLYQGKYIDPHTEFLCQELKTQGVSFNKYQSSFNFDKLSRRTIDVKHLDSVFLISSIKSKLKSFFFVAKDVEKINLITNIFEEKFKMTFNFPQLIENEIKLFKANCVFFDSLFKKKKPKQVYIVNFCDKPALIATAKKNKINVIDIQHGLISSEDVIYNYPDTIPGSLNYFPDKFYIWSKIWQETCKIPLKPENIVVYGNNYLDKQVENYSYIKKNNLQLLVVSQPGLSQQIAAEIINKISAFKDFKIIYKLHPSEYKEIHKYAEFKQLKKSTNIEFAEINTDLYKLLAETKYVIGVYSTVLIEALIFNCEVKLLNLPGVEMMGPFRLNENVSIIE